MLGVLKLGRHGCSSVSFSSLSTRSDTPGSQEAACCRSAVACLCPPLPGTLNKRHVFTSTTVLISWGQGSWDNLRDKVSPHQSLK